MSWRRLLGSLLLVAGTLAATGSATVAQDTAEADPLELAGRWLIGFEERLSSILAEERYTQTTSSAVRPSWGQRSARPEIETVRLRSHLLLVRSPGPLGTWQGYRDVVEVDGEPVPDRIQRLEDILGDRSLAGVPRWRQLAAESARYNLGEVHRNVNVPTFALLFLRDGIRARFDWKLVGGKRIDGVETVRAKFRERARPTLIRAGDEDVVARGSFWIDPASGRVLRSVLETGDGRRTVRARIEVEFRVDRELGELVPVEMKETYENGRGQTVEGRATYSGFHRFAVDVEIAVDSP